MSNEYLDRYQYFIEDGNFRIVPGIEIPIKGTDRYIQFKKGKDRLDKIAKEIERFNAITSLQDYKRGVELYNLYYGEK